MTNFSKDQLDKIRPLLERVGVKPECPTCQQGMVVLDRGQFGLQEVAQLRENPRPCPAARLDRLGTAGAATGGQLRAHHSQRDVTIVLHGRESSLDRAEVAAIVRERLERLAGGELSEDGAGKGDRG